MYQLDKVDFVCKQCKHRFKDIPTRVENVPGRFHPWDYFGECPNCGERDVPQAAWQKGLMASMAPHIKKGPATPEGLQKCIDKINSVDKEEVKKRRQFGALQHGMYAEAATYFPARPDKYPECDTCDIYNDCKAEIAYHKTLPLKERPIVNPCRKKLELFMLHYLAFQQNDPTIFKRINAVTQASLRGILDRMIHTIIKDGVTIKTPQWYQDKETGQPQVVSYTNPETGKTEFIFDYQANPLIRQMLEFVSRNNLSLGDMGMTQKAVEEDQLIKGYLAKEERAQDDMAEFQRKQASSVDKLMKLIGQGTTEPRPPITINQTPDPEPEE